ncbi:hypothetical protein [Kaistella antarctica]|uniref:Lipoprotein n=1 Tax=Kaistella antarctica TaxID=266748 RepID=A0A3S4WSS4_9FLAO|nr:hypothetical protein [Kaistella antarctica]KEY18744.1 hypothetical protein HY04_09715 [Kaistella antarctica]SEW15946.1 hypothetical protein SAMN05421765_2790 [Kaistella antarctica]VEH99605.1 Uncharacterised protein [Kaistella antarctica]
MKHLLIILISASTVASCSLRKVKIDEDTLPKDISEKPHNHFTQEEEQLQMKKLIKEIDSIVATESCTDPADWKFTAIGSKACGGPSSYIAYPLKLEDQVLPKVTQFTSMQSAFNTKYGLVSDCALVMPPLEIKCENGKPVLIGDRLEKEVVE